MLETQKEFYKSVVAKTDYTDNGWDNVAKAIERYQIIAGILEVFGVQEVTDVGCGCGHLAKYLPEDIKYSGIDAMEEFITKGKKLYPNLDLTYQPEIKDDQKFKNVVCLGTYTLKGDQTSEEYEEYAKESLSRLVRNTEGIVVVVGFRKRNDYEDKHLFYTDVDMLMEIADKEGVSVQINNALKYNFIAVFEPNNF